jgi:hypothetical protein
MKAQSRKNKKPCSDRYFLFIFSIYCNAMMDLSRRKDGG